MKRATHTMSEQGLLSVMRSPSARDKYRAESLSRRNAKHAGKNDDFSACFASLRE